MDRGRPIRSRNVREKCSVEFVPIDLVRLVCLVSLLHKFDNSNYELQLILLSLPVYLAFSKCYLVFLLTAPQTKARGMIPANTA
jgi:hypothetical protein